MGNADKDALGFAVGAGEVESVEGVAGVWGGEYGGVGAAGDVGGRGFLGGGLGVGGLGVGELCGGIGGVHWGFLVDGCVGGGILAEKGSLKRISRFRLPEYSRRKTKFL